MQKRHLPFPTPADARFPLLNLTNPREVSTVIETFAITVETSTPDKEI
jgi:hypothetical protein